MHWTHRIVRCGSFKLDAGCMFGLIPRVVWSRWLEPDEHNRMEMQTNAVLLESEGGKLVVVEVGIGDKFDEKSRGMYAQEPLARDPSRARAVHDALEEIDCSPADVSAVIVSHLHFDHAGGLTRLERADPGGAPALTFANAEVIVQRREWEDAVANRSTMHKTYLRDHINDAVAERLRLVDGDAEVLPGLHVAPCPGHTWGQQLVRWQRAGAGDAVFVPDVMPTRFHHRSTTNLAYDVEPYTSMHSRRRLLESANDEGWLLVLDHEPGHPTFLARPDDKRAGEYVLEASE